MNLVILNDDETLSINNTSNIVILFNLTHDIMHLNSYHDQSVLVALFILNGRLTIRVNMMNVNDKTLFSVLQNFIEIFILWCHESFKSCESSSTLNFRSSCCSFKIIFRAFLICFDQTIVNIKENICV